MNPLKEVEFRDGTREIFGYLADLMVGIETHRYTYEEALALMNDTLAKRHVSKVVDKAVAEHLARWGL